MFRTVRHYKHLIQELGTRDPLSFHKTSYSSNGRSWKEKKTYRQWSLHGYDFNPPRMTQEYYNKHKKFMISDWSCENLTGDKNKIKRFFNGLWEEELND